MQSNLFDYVSTTKNESSELLKLIKFNISAKVYNYGDHFIGSKKPKKISLFIKWFIYYIYGRLINYKRGKLSSIKNIGLSSTYNNFDKKLEQEGFYADRMSHSLKKGRRTAGSFSLSFNMFIIQQDFIYKNYNYLISPKFLLKIKKYQIQIEELILKNKYRYLLVPNDIDFFSAIYIKAFKKFGKPTFIIAHGGMPSIYDKIMDNQTDYVTMWGKKQVDAYVKMGYDKNKFFITGHPFYNMPPKSLKFNFDDILVITKSINGVCPLDQPHLEDRGNIIMYLYAIQNTLLRLGIKKVKLRPHPSENRKWYMSFLDKNFFSLDKLSLNESLNKSTLVIGPTSTTIIDAMAHSVNYTIFEPTVEGKLITGFPVNPPLDGSDPRIPIARNEEGLLEILQNRKCIDISVYKEFADPNFDISFMKKILDDWFK
jgi:hypothetical protein